MANIYVKSGNATQWAANTVYAAGSKVVASTSNYWVYYTATGGTSGGTEPVWNNTDGGTSPTDGTITDWVSYPASSWTYATITLTRAGASSVAGDYIYVSNNHAESTATAISPTFAGTVANPCYVLCADDTSGTPPTTLATTATVSTTGVSSLIVSGAIYCYGITFTAGSGAVSANLGLGAIANSSSTTPCSQVYDTCKFRLGSTSASTNVYVLIGSALSAANRTVVWKNCSLKFGSSGAGQAVYTKNASFWWEGGSIESGSSSPSTGIFRADASGNMTVSGVDFSNLSSSMYFFAPSANMITAVMIRDCKMPSGWANTVVNTTISGPYAPVGVYNSSGSAVNYNTVYQNYFGKIVPETTYVRSGGASDGVTPLSWKMVSTSGAIYPNGTCVTPEIVTWVNNTGVSKNVTVEILHDSATNLKDDEIWLEVMYLASSATPLGTWINDSKATVLSTATDQATSSATWTTTGMANPNKQKLSVTVTFQMKGYVHARVVMAKPSKTVYVDPVVTVA